MYAEIVVFQEFLYLQTDKGAFAQLGLIELWKFFHHFLNPFEFLIASVFTNCFMRPSVKWNREEEHFMDQLDAYPGHL